MSRFFFGLAVIFGLIGAFTFLSPYIAIGWAWGLAICSIYLSVREANR